MTFNFIGEQDAKHIEDSELARGPTQLTNVSEPMAEDIVLSCLDGRSSQSELSQAEFGSAGGLVDPEEESADQEGTNYKPNRDALVSSIINLVNFLLGRRDVPARAASTHATALFQ